MHRKLNWEADPLRLPGLFAPRISIKRQGAYHLTSAYRRAGSWWKGIFIVELDSREKRIEVSTYSYARFDSTYDDEENGTAEVYVGPRGQGDHTIFYSEEDEGAPEYADIDNYTLVHIQFPRPLTTYIPARVRRVLRIPTRDWHSSIDENYDKYGFTFIAYRYGW